MCPTTSRTACLHCSGTIVSDRHVLSAAHCFKDIEPRYADRGLRDQLVRVTSHNGSNPKTGFLDDEVNVTVHPKYDFVYAFPGFDVAIIELSKRITFSDYDQPICIVDSFRENDGEVGYVVGYGFNSVNNTVPLNRTGVDVNGKMVIIPGWNFTYNPVDGEPHESLIQFRTIDRCESLKLPVSVILRHSERTFCAAANNRVIAQGDSGGPLMINRRFPPYLSSAL